MDGNNNPGPPAAEDAISPAWAALRQHHADMAAVHMRDLFTSDAERASRLSLEACGLFLDYSRHRINDDSLVKLIALAEEAGVGPAIERLFAGAPVNSSEGRAALHMALRHSGGEAFPTASANVMPDVQATRARMRAFCGRLRSGRVRGVTERPLTTVVALGIGGSHLGPALACTALSAYAADAIDVHFVSNLDGSAVNDVLRQCAAEETLFVITSKTFGTEETLTNARTARAWLTQRLGNEPSVCGRHFVAVTANVQRAEAFGVDSDNIFEIRDWVGGRYSLWSAVGLPLAVSIGMDAFEEMLAGAAEMDAHFRSAPAKANMPIILALLEVWNRNLFGATTRVVVPYDHALRRFPEYLQQLEMESNGKRVGRDGSPVKHATAPVVWGTTGSDGQHAFFQLLHQGGTLIPADLIVSLENPWSLPGHQNALIANALAQATALMRGRSLAEVEQALRQQGLSETDIAAQAPHRVMPGNQPSSVLIYEQLDPRTLGALMALYEHKVFVESVIWDINAFDQWGVELGKTVAQDIRPLIDAARMKAGAANESLSDRVHRLLEACSRGTS